MSAYRLLGFWMKRSAEETNRHAMSAVTGLYVHHDTGASVVNTIVKGARKAHNRFTPNRRKLRNKTRKARAPNTAAA